MGERAPYGILLDNPIDNHDSNTLIYAVSGQLIGMHWESAIWLGVEWDVWILEFCFGTDSNGEPIIGNLFFGGDKFMVPLTEIYHVWLWFDPNASDEAKAKEGSGGAIKATDFVDKMEIGRLYPMFLVTRNNYYPSEDQHMFDYNRELFNIMRGLGVTLPEDVYGNVAEIFLISTYGYE